MVSVLNLRDGLSILVVKVRGYLGRLHGWLNKYFWGRKEGRGIWKAIIRLPLRRFPDLVKFFLFSQIGWKGGDKWVGRDYS